MRFPEQRLADLRAQRAANRVGAERLTELAQRHGIDRLRAGMEEILAYAERRTRAAIAALPDGTLPGRGHARGRCRRRPRDILLRVEATIAGDSLRLDFAGTDPQVDGNLNCPLSVTKSAAYFAVRVLTDPDAPPSAGAYRPIEVLAPAGCLLNARQPAAVVAGNVETSSRVADLVIAALAGARPVPAQGQGTMNNLTLANEDFTYYETIGGGQGACPDADGPSAIHVAMSNTLNTPIEALEAEFPLRVRELSMRRGSGGDGRARRRRRDRPRDRGTGPDALHPDHRAPPPSAAGSRRRRRRRAGAQPAQRRPSCRARPRVTSITETSCGSRLPEAAAAASLTKASIWRFRCTSSRMPGLGRGSQPVTGFRGAFLPSRRVTDLLRYSFQMPIALKEWAVTVRALAEGEQLLTLRKGGIREENKHFELDHERFFLYPTFDHQRNNLVRESHHPELRRALEEGVWPDEEPPPAGADPGRRNPAARPGPPPLLGRGHRPLHDHQPARGRRPLPLLRLDARLRREAAQLEAAPPAPHPAAPGPPHPAAGDRPGP